MSFRHNYFASGFCNRLSLVPTPQSSKTIQNFGLKTNLSNAFFEIACPDREQFSLKKAFKSIENLNFFVVSSDELFSNYSQLPFLGKSEYLLFSSHTSSQKLHTSDWVTADNVVEYRPMSFQVDLEKYSSSTYKLVRKMTGEVLDVFDEIPEEQSMLSINLRGEDWGVYALEGEEGEVLENWFVADATPKGCIGIIELDLTKYEKEDLPLDFEICFQARETIWKYLFMSRKNKKVGGLKVMNGKEEIKFSEATTSQILNGEPATVIESEKPLTLNEISAHRFHVQLLDDEGNAKNHPRMILPNASAKTIKPRKEGEDWKVYSEMYVYI